MSLMTRLKFERLRRGWSQVELAERAKVANSYISKFERGVALPYDSQARRLSKALQIPTEQLLESVDATLTAR
jgi:transcriptional regulator with XRE-family HTH domain